MTTSESFPAVSAKNLLRQALVDVSAKPSPVKNADNIEQLGEFGPYLDRIKQTDSLEDRIEAYKELLAKLKASETKELHCFLSGVEDFTLPLLRDIRSATQTPHDPNLSAHALRLLGYLLFKDEITKKICQNPRAVEEILTVLRLCFEECPDCSVKQLCVWCLGTLRVPGKLLSNYLPQIIPCLLAASNVSDTLIRTEAITAMLNLFKQSPVGGCSMVNNWLLNVFELCLDDMPSVRDKAEHILAFMMPKLIAIPGCLDRSIKVFYAEKANVFATRIETLQCKDKYLIRIWSHVVLFLGKTLSRTEFLQVLLRRIETCFNNKKQWQIRKYAFQAWARLIYNFAMSLLMDEKRITLLMSPILLSIREEEDDHVVDICLRTWKKILFSVDSKVQEFAPVVLMNVINKDVFSIPRNEKMRSGLYECGKQLVEKFLNGNLNKTTAEKNKRILEDEDIAWTDIQLKCDSKWLKQNIQWLFGVIDALADADKDNLSLFSELVKWISLTTTQEMAVNPKPINELFTAVLESKSKYAMLSDMIKWFTRRILLSTNYIAEDEHTLLGVILETYCAGMDSKTFDRLFSVLQASELVEDALPVIMKHVDASFIGALLKTSEAVRQLVAKDSNVARLFDQAQLVPLEDLYDEIKEVAHNVRGTIPLELKTSSDAFIRLVLEYRHLFELSNFGALLDAIMFHKQSIGDDKEQLGKFLELLSEVLSFEQFKKQPELALKVLPTLQLLANQTYDVSLTHLKRVHQQLQTVFTICGSHLSLTGDHVDNYITYITTGLKSNERKIREAVVQVYNRPESVELLKAYFSCDGSATASEELTQLLHKNRRVLAYVPSTSSSSQSDEDDDVPVKSLARRILLKSQISSKRKHGRETSPQAVHSTPTVSKKLESKMELNSGDVKATPISILKTKDSGGVNKDRRVSFQVEQESETPVRAEKDIVRPSLTPYRKEEEPSETEKAAKRLKLSDSLDDFMSCLKTVDTSKFGELESSQLLFMQSELLRLVNSVTGCLLMKAKEAEIE